MAGTRQLATVLDHVEDARGKLALVSDDRQLAASNAQMLAIDASLIRNA